MNLFFSSHCYLDGSWIFAHDRVGHTFANPDFSLTHAVHFPLSGGICRALRAYLSLEKQLSSTRQIKEKEDGKFQPVMQF